MKQKTRPKKISEILVIGNRSMNGRYSVSSPKKPYWSMSMADISSVLDSKHLDISRFRQ